MMVEVGMVGRWVCMGARRAACELLKGILLASR